MDTRLIIILKLKLVCWVFQMMRVKQQEGEADHDEVAAHESCSVRERTNTKRCARSQLHVNQNKIVTTLTTSIQRFRTE